MTSLARSLFSILVLAVLAGCSLLTPPKYDDFEYNYAVMSAVSATRAVHLCAERGEAYQQRLQELNSASLHLQEYVTHREGAQASKDAIAELRTLVNAVIVAPGSARYCQHKLSEVQALSRVLAKTFSGHGRVNMCFSDAGDRYRMYAESYKQRLITQAERDELVGDVLRLRSADLSGCTVEARVRLQEVLDSLVRLATSQ